MTTTLDSPFATSASLTHGFDPRLFYGHSLASDSVTTANLISVYDFGTNKQPRVNSSPGLRLTPVPGITELSDQIESADQPHATSHQASAPVESQQQQMLAMMQHIQTLTHQVTDLFHAVRAGQYSSTPQPVYASPHINPPLVYQTPHPPEPCLPPPEKYDVEPGGCRPFITQCRLIFSLQPSSFSTERTQVAYISRGPQLGRLICPTPRHLGCLWRR